MHRGPPVDAPPPRAHGTAGAWVEISAWILAFAILLAAQCLPDRFISHGAGPQTTDARGR
jgi:hypothetical protein